MRSSSLPSPMRASTRHRRFCWACMEAPMNTRAGPGRTRYTQRQPQAFATSSSEASAKASGPCCPGGKARMPGFQQRAIDERERRVAHFFSENSCSSVSNEPVTICALFLACPAVTGLILCQFLQHVPRSIYIYIYIISGCLSKSRCTSEMRTHSDAPNCRCDCCKSRVPAG